MLRQRRVAGGVRSPHSHTQALLSRPACPLTPPRQGRGCWCSSGGSKQLQLTDKLQDYILQHTREPEVLKALRRDTAAQFSGREQNQILPEQGQFLAWLVEALGVRRAIEVGVFTGYSSIAVALALPADGKLLVCEKDPAPLQLAREYWQRAGVAGKVVEHVRPAHETLEELLKDGGANTFDFAFIDADKRAYGEYFELLLQLVRTGGIIVVDNVLWYGRVADSQETAKSTIALRSFNDRLMRDDRISLSIVPVGDGMALTRKRPEASIL